MRERPVERISLGRRRHDLLSFMAPLMLLGRKRVRCEVPACPECRRAFLWHRRWQRIVLILGVAGALAVCGPWIDGLGLMRPLRKVLTLAVIVVMLGPILAWQTVRPRAVDITVGKEDVEYEFRNPEYAALFRAANLGDAGHGGGFGRRARGVV